MRRRSRLHDLWRRYPHLQNAYFLPLHTRRATKEAKVTSHDTIITPDVHSEEDPGEPTNHKDVELDVIYVYQAADLEAYIDPEHFHALDDANCNFHHHYASPVNPSSTPVAYLPILLELSEIIATQKTGNFCQIFFAKMGNTKSFLFEGMMVRCTVGIPTSWILNLLCSAKQCGLVCCI